MNIDNNTANNNVTSINHQNNVVQEEDNSEEARLKREAEVGEHDIVIEEDFPINIEVSEVSSYNMGENPTQQTHQEQVPEIGTEQSGKITF